ncbi:unnamed protein product [Sphagnum compactum]
MEWPPVTRLVVHLPGQHNVIFNENEDLAVVAERAAHQKTTLTAYFARRTHQITSQLRTRTHCSSSSSSSSSSGFPESDEPYLQDLRVPLEWVTSPAAAQ